MIRPYHPLAPSASAFSLGPIGQNQFGAYGDTLANAIIARDAYFTANPGILASYDANSLWLVQLLYTDATVNKFQFNSRAAGEWVNTFDQEVSAVDLSTHSVTELNDVTNAGAGIIPDAATNAKTAALITDGVTNKTANFTINAASESDHTGKTTVYSAAVDGVCTLGDLTSDTVWASSKVYTIRTVVNPLTINAGAGRLFDNASSSVTIKPGESMQLQGANIGGSKVFIKKLDSIHGLAKIKSNGALVSETDEVNFAGNVVEVNDISGEANVNIRADQLFFTHITNSDIFNFNDVIWGNLIADGKYAFGATTANSSNMPPVKGTGAYTCYAWSIGKLGTGSTLHQRISISFAGSMPEVFERSGNDLASAITNGWKTFGEVKASFAVTSNATVAVSSNAAAPSIITGFSAFGALNGFTLDAVNGAVINSSGRSIGRSTGSIAVQPVKSGGGAAQVMRLWSETSPDGITWTVQSNSLRTFEIPSDGETFKTSVSIDEIWADGEYLRFACYSTGGGSLSLAPTSDTVRGQTITGPSVIWNLQED